MRRHFPGLTALGTMLLAVLLAMTLASGPAPAQSSAELRDRLGDIEDELSEIRERFGIPQRSGRDGAMSDVLVRLDQLEGQLRELTGRLERLEYQQRRMAEDAARRFGDIEFRLTELEGGDVSNLEPVPPLGGGAAGEGTGTKAVSVSERSDLERAVEDVRQGRYDLAEDRLRNFLNDYPDSPLEPEARYWLGESQLTRGAYQDAARSYLAGYKADRTGASAPRNLLGLSVTLGRLGQVNEACLTLEEVRNQFPRGPQEILDRVEEEADALGCG